VFETTIEELTELLRMDKPELVEIASVLSRRD